MQRPLGDALIKRDLRFYLWVVVAVLAALLYFGAPMARAGNKRIPNPPSWEDIASFYSGGNMRGPITYDYTNSMGTNGSPMSGQIMLNPKVKDSLDAFLRYGPKSQQGMVMGALGLSTLIHEALHNRANQGDFDNSNEMQEGDLGVRLIPDLLQRFFGVPMDSAWGKKYTDMVLSQLRPVGH